MLLDFYYMNKVWTSLMNQFRGLILRPSAAASEAKRTMFSSDAVQPRVAQTENTQVKYKYLQIVLKYSTWVNVELLSSTERHRIT